MARDRAVPLNDSTNAAVTPKASKIAALKAQRNRVVSAGTPGGVGDTTSDNNTSSSLSLSSRGNAAAHQQQRRRISGVAGNARRVSGIGAAPALQADPNRFDEWMKMATDNKINSTNTWNFALIDYFHDMSLLRGDDGNSINFQKASCTLDGCVKIWTSRVDSVAAETGKLLSGLATNPNGTQNGVMDDDEEEGARSGDEEQEGRKRRRKVIRQGATLADSFDKIRAKQLELEFTVDPLFKKTSADFDEGGAAGILMNHLACDESMRVVFDAGDAKVIDDDEDVDDEERQPEDEEAVAAKKAAEAKDRELDLSKLKDKFVPSLETLDDMCLCPSLSSFKFSSSASGRDLLAGLFDSSNALGAGDEASPAEISFTNDDDDGAGGFMPADGNEDLDGMGGGSDGPVDFFGGDNMDGGAADHGGAGWGYAIPGFNAPGENDDDPDGEGEAFVDGLASGAATRFDAFDAAFAKNWAGPEHWKLRRPVRKDAAATGGSGTARQRKEKVAFVIDFDNPPAQTAKELFASAPASTISTTSRRSSAGGSGARRSSVKTPASATGEADRHLLPDDHQFSSQILLRLFLKPRSYVNLKRRGAHRGPAAAGPNADDGDVDEQFWANGGAILPPTGAGVDMGGGDDYGYEDPGAAALPFSTQWLDDGDAPDYEDFIDGAGAVQGDDADGADASGGADDDLLAATQGQLKRVRPEMVSFAKRAKRVDVKKLKESIWKELEVVVRPSKSAEDGGKENEEPSDDEDDEREEAAETSTQKKDGEAFGRVIDGIRQLYPADKMQEISTSYCFICLLHLCNEQGLGIDKAVAMAQERSSNTDTGVDPMMRRVGQLSDLRVFREMTAA